MKLVLTLGGLAALLAAVGIYGVVSFAVSQRTRELGIRIALGAGKADNGRLVFSSSARPILAGLTTGLMMAVAAGSMLVRVTSNMSLTIRAYDPATYAAVAALLVLVTIAAMLGPARRAAASDPMWALRQE